MKSLFANEEIILPSWLKILLETIDSETIQKLSENQEYRKMQIRRKELLEHYPIIEKVIDDEGKVSISEQEHKALLEYFLVKDRMENEERLYHYLYGWLEWPLALRFLYAHKGTLCTEVSLQQARQWMREGIQEAKEHGSRR